MSRIVRQIEVSSPATTVFDLLTEFASVERWFPVVQRTGKVGDHHSSSSPAPSWCIPGRAVAWESVSNTYRVSPEGLPDSGAALLFEIQSTGESSTVTAELHYGRPTWSPLAHVLRRRRLRARLDEALRALCAHSESRPRVSAAAANARAGDALLEGARA